MSDLPRWVARMRHTQSRLHERYGLRLTWKQLIALRHCVKFEFEERPERDSLETMLLGRNKALIIRCRRKTKSDGHPYLIGMFGKEFALIYSPETDCFATAIPSYMVASLKAELVLGSGKDVKA